MLSVGSQLLYLLMPVSLFPVECTTGPKHKNYRSYRQDFKIFFEQNFRYRIVATRSSPLQVHINVMFIVPQPLTT